MAAYPSINFTIRSDPTNVDTLELVRADNGTPYGYAYGPGRKREFALEHNAVTAAEHATLMAFYDANRTAGGIVLTWNNADYTCLFAAPPKETPLGGNRWRVVMRLAEE